MRLFVITASLFATTQAFACGMYIPLEMKVADIGSVMEKVDEEPPDMWAVGELSAALPAEVVAPPLIPEAQAVVAEPVVVQPVVAEPVPPETGRKARKKSKRNRKQPNS